MSGRTLLIRALALIPTLVGASLVAFLIGAIAPGDPAFTALAQGGEGNPEPSAVAALRQAWGLDQPLPGQFMTWLGRVLRGDLGVSYFSGRPVAVELGERLGATVILAISAATLALATGVTIGTVCALTAGSLFDRLLQSLSIMLSSLPGFVLAIIGISVLAESLRLAPTSGYGTLAHLILPALVLSIGESARLLRLTRTELLTILQSEYIRVARAKGLTEHMIAVRHALPNALINILTSLGLYFGAILGGAAIIETIFAWPGIGRLAVEAIQQRDYPVAQGVVLLSTVIYAVINLIVDLLYHVVDPRLQQVAR